MASTCRGWRRTGRSGHREATITQKVIICIGFAKCGTTSLHGAFAAMPNARVPKGSKELKYFQRDSRSADQYLSLFTGVPEGVDPEDTVIFESSPPYASGSSGEQVRDLLGRIKALFPQAIIVVCMRQPVRRAFSHYLHALQKHAVFGLAPRAMRTEPAEMNALLNPYTLDFTAALFKNDSLRRPYHDALQAAYDLFGPGQVEPFFLERDVEGFHGFMARLSDKAGCDLHSPWQGRAAPRERSGKPMPAYAYAARAREVPCHGGTIPLEAGDLLVRSGEDAFVLRGVPEQAGRRMELVQSCWSRGVAAETGDLAMDAFFREDIRQSAALLAGYGVPTDVLESYLVPMDAYRMDLAASSAIAEMPVAQAAKLRVVEFAGAAGAGLFG